MSEFDHQKLDVIIHSRIRLSVMAILASAADAEFTYLRDRVNATDGNLGMHLRKLEEAGYVAVKKMFVERKPVSRYRLTAAGREAFRRYVERLERMLKAKPVQHTAEPSREARAMGRDGPQTRGDSR